MKFISHILLFIFGGIFCLVGLNALFAPADLTEPIGITLNTPGAFNEIRANYGGMHLFFGLFFVICSFRLQTLKIGFGLVALYLGGLLFGRITSLLIDGPANQFVLNLTYFESFMFLVSGLMWKIVKTPTPAWVP